MSHRTKAAAGSRPRRTWPRRAWPGLRPAWPTRGPHRVSPAGRLPGHRGRRRGDRAPAAKADTVPPAPSGWTTVFGDNFAGSAGSAPAASNWFYDIGTGYGTGESEQTTNSTSNVYLDGNGHLVLKATDNGGTWTSGRIESTRDDFQAPPGGKLEMTASIEQPNPASGLGYWPAFWALGSPMRTGGGWPQSGEIDMMEDVNGLNEASQTLHDSANSPGHALISCPNTGSGCQTGYHTYSVIVDRTNTSAETLQFLMDGTVESTITEASVGTAAWQAAIDHGFFIIFDLAMGGNYPDGDLRLHHPDLGHLVRRVDERGLRRRVRAGRQLHPDRDGQRDRPAHRARRAVPDQPELAQHRGQPDRRERLQRRRRPAVVALHGRDAAHPGRLPGRGQRRDDQRHRRRLVPV